MKTIRYLLCLLLFQGCFLTTLAQNKAVFIILDGIPADVLETVETPVIDEIASQGGYTLAFIGGEKGAYSESPTISAVGYNHLLTATWSNKHNVWGNEIKDPNYHYWNIFRIAESADPALHTAIFSTWLDNRTKLIGEGLPEAGSIQLDYAFDGFEHDTIAFPHAPDRLFIFNIDEHVSKEAGRYMAAHGPDLSWVYLEFTDDMGHKYGDSPQLTDAVKKADVQVGRIWHAIQERQQQYDEEWMIFITTDHGRDAATGKHHGGQSDRERTIWIVTNHDALNQRFDGTPAMVDIMPSILRFMDIQIPESVKAEMDGIPFIGEISISNLQAVRQGEEITLTWDVINPEGQLEILLAITNHFKEGKSDTYHSMGMTDVATGRYTLDVGEHISNFYKVLVKAPYNWTNRWIIIE